MAWQLVPQEEDGVGQDVLGPSHAPRLTGPAGTFSPLEDPNFEYETVAHDETESHALQTDRLYLAEAEALDQTTLPANKQRALQRWLLMITIGTVVAGVGILVSFGVTELVRRKIEFIQGIVASEMDGGAVFGSAFFVYLLINVSFCCCAVFFGLMEPACTGSGMPEVKALLNGVDVPYTLSLKTLLCKVGGIVSAMAANMAVGNLGPMIHAGVIVANQVAWAASLLPDVFAGANGVSIRASFFRTPIEMRDLMTCGSAAGVATAFGAPVGGVLFALEEGASFWSTKLTLRTFVTALVSAFLVNLLYTSDTWGREDQSAMFSFGPFTSSSDDEAAYSTWELFMFVFLGLLGGLGGACFNSLNHKLALIRRERVTTRRMMVAEVLTAGLLVTAVTFLLPAVFGRCITLPSITEESTAMDQELADELVSFYCQEDAEYNDLASLFLTSPDVTIKQLFHFSAEDEDGDENTVLSETSLFLFAIFYTILAAVTYGSHIPAGLFLPMLLVGAALGRLFGQIFEPLLDAEAGVYALIGAAAMLGGMSRMTISVTVILLEATGDVQFGLPIILTLLPAKWIGDIFGSSLYVSYMHLRGMPFLPNKPNEAILHQPVKSIMATDVLSVTPRVQVGTVVDLLAGCTHHGFPVVQYASEASGSERRGKQLLGTISRELLCVLLQRRVFAEAGVDREAVSLVELHETELDPAALRINAGDRQLSMDLTPYYSVAPFSVVGEASVARAYSMFRHIGMRHLVVVNRRNEVIGILTRKDFLRERPRTVTMSSRSPRSRASGAGRRQRAPPAPQVDTELQ